MLESAETAINRMIQRAEAEAKELYVDQNQNEAHVTLTPMPINDEEAVQVTLEDGTVATVRGL